MRVKPDAFLHCAKCKKVLFSKEFERNLWVCGYCAHHHRLSALDRIRITFDQGTFEELDANLRSLDPLEFPEYMEKLDRAESATGRLDPIVRGTASLEGVRLATAISDFGFMGGSMGSVAGEKIARTLELSAAERIPAIVFTASGGARMQEGLLSLMQMAKTAAACMKLSEAGAPFICVFTDPTMAGVLASYASLADVVLAEPQALIGFAGSRVSAQAGVAKVPDDFQTSEYGLAHGMIDRIVRRKDMRETLATLLRHLAVAERG